MALAAATIATTPGSASAADTPPGINWDHIYSATGVKVYVEEHGDIISVCDTVANGHSASVKVTAPVGTWTYTSTVTAGAGSCKTHQASEGGAYDMPEGHYIDLDYVGDGGSLRYSTFLNDH